MRSNKKMGKTLSIRITTELDERLERVSRERCLRKPDLVRWLLSRVGEVDTIKPGQVISESE